VFAFALFSYLSLSVLFNDTCSISCERILCMYLVLFSYVMYLTLFKWILHFVVDPECHDLPKRLDCLLSSIWIRYCIDSCYWKLLGNNSQTVTHALFYYSTVYTVLLSTLLSLLHWYCYCCHIVTVIEITWKLIVIK